MWYLIVSIPDLCTLTYFVYVYQAGSVDESEFTEMKEKLMEQESIIDDLQKEMEGLRILSVQHKEQAHKVRLHLE